MSLPKIDLLTDDVLLALYGRAKTNVMLTQLFARAIIAPEILDFINQLSREISVRGLDRKETNAAD